MTTLINLFAWIALYFVPTQYNYLIVFCVLAAFSLAFNDVLSKKKKDLFLFLYVKQMTDEKKVYFDTKK
jgi:hypothetical protein